MESKIFDKLNTIKSLKGKIYYDFELYKLTWFRTGGNCEVYYVPADEDDLANLLKQISKFKIPITIIGLGSNLLIRDGGVEGIVIRLNRQFGSLKILDDFKVKVGCSLNDRHVAKKAAQNDIANLAFLAGIPGSIGGALRMNAGAHGGEIKDVFISAKALDFEGNYIDIKYNDMGFSYRKTTIRNDLIFLSAILQGKKGSKEEVDKEIEFINSQREQTQPIKSKTGGSTFKNPLNNKAWKLIDAAGCRGLKIGGAHMSEMHCNFIINDGEASATDIEGLMDEVDKRVFEHSGIRLKKEIKIIGNKK